MKFCLIAPPTLDQFDEGPLRQSEESRARFANPLASGYNIEL
jgi:hypothetical protein